MSVLQRKMAASATGICGDVDSLDRRLRAAGLAGGVAHDLVVRYPAAQIRDALDALSTRKQVEAVGWLVRAISEAWNVRAEAGAIRRARARVQHEQAAVVEAARREQERDRRLAGWAAAISDALTDQQLTDAVELVTEPIDWLGRRSAPLATTQLLAWALHATTSAPQEPPAAVLDRALQAAHSTVHALPKHVPMPPPTSTLTTVDIFRDRVRRAIDVLERTASDHQVEQERTLS